ncbi:protein HIRA homolog [Condylostylus longicornis]|uniref:protein HIRA homolog n=1 Tax=Condylostylus longicornis TaxID=2530218 RepID=UPI00244E2B1E|nr:protein HIRA homolog [Condylostylus longicornis]
MKLLKPHWVHHDEKPIFSVDIHPNCLKFATGGQGNDSGRVVVWNLLPVISEEAEEDENIPKILCQMDNHLACVNCVRWSENGQMLASGSDDKLVMIWKMCKGPSGVFGTDGITKNPESWKCIYTLRGHSGDVLDVAWSPGDRRLASCSVDNSIIIWDAQAFPTIISVLKGHTGLVKGVAWDPVEKFLASQSDDRSIKIWKTSDWNCNNTITDPFEECGGTTHILRLSWSPDGQYLVSAHAMNGGGPTAQIIEREGWKCDKDFVGHRKAVTCVRFHNSILKRHAPKTKKSQQYCCLAVGSRDRSLSVWMTALQRPMVVIHDLFQDSVLDLSWGPEKCVLLACSGDGTVACLQFSEKELGTPLSEEDKNMLYHRIYGKSASAFENNNANDRDMVIENSELLEYAQEKHKPPVLPVLKSVNKADLDNFSTETTQNQITNVHLKTAINKQIETITVDGKRRITPVFIPLSLEGEKNISEFISSSRINCTVPKEKIHNLTKTDQNTISAKITTVEKAHLDNRLTKTVISAPAKSSGISNSIITQTKQIRQNSIINVPNKLNIIQNHSISSCKTSNETSKIAGDFRVFVKNSFLKTSVGALCRVNALLLSTGEKLWEKLIGSAVANFSVSVKYVMICTLDGNIRFLFTKNGSVVVPILSISTAATQCAFCPSGKLAGVISECGSLKIWNVEEKKIFISASCSEMFKKCGQVIQFSITESGTPIVLFCNGTSYSYSETMKCWLVLNSQDPVIMHGLQSTIPKDLQKNFAKYPLMSVQAATFGHQSFLDINSSKFLSGAKLDFIENQIKLSELINAPDELIYWYSMLGYFLCTEGTEKKMRSVLDDLAKTSNLYSSHSNYCNRVLNTEKCMFLKTILNILKSHSKWQRIYMEYNEQLNLQQTDHIEENNSIDNTL